MPTQQLFVQYLREHPQWRAPIENVIRDRGVGLNLNVLFDASLIDLFIEANNAT